MSWCQANIGVGALPDARSTDAEIAKDAVRLPYSLSEPILSRLPGAPEKEKGLFPGVGSALSSYLLKLLDSPAYSNLTPSFLANHFNPQTPDRDDIRYFSIAARAGSLGVWHPLWLPKLVLDAADAKRHQELHHPKSEGNDGLVPIESAKWGHFLGVVESCDHWELRGGAGFRRPSETVQRAEEHLATAQETSQAGLEAVYQRIGQMQDQSQDGTTRSDSSATAKIASWISKRIPFAQAESKPVRPIAIPPEQDIKLRFTSRTKPKPGRFNLEGLYVALTRNLYDAGL
jgi:triacylglycerol lipase